MSSGSRPASSFFSDWISRGGALAFACIVFVVVFTVVPDKMHSLLGAREQSVILLLMLSVWLYAIFTCKDDRSCRVALILISIGVVCVNAALMINLPWLNIVAFIGSIILVFAPLALPRERAITRPKSQVWLDIANTIVVASLFILFSWNAPGSPDIAGEAGAIVGLERQMILIVAVASTIGMNLLLSRTPRPDVSAATIMFAASAFTMNVSAFIPAVLPPRDPNGGTISMFGSAVGFILFILAAEGLRLGWRWPWTRQTQDFSPISVATVLALAAFVAVIGYRERASGIGPLMIGAVAALALLLARLGLSMRQNVRLEAERSRLEAENRVASLFQHTTDIILVADSDFRIQRATPSVSALWAQAPQDLLGTHILNLIEPEHRAEASRIFQERLAAPGSSSVFRWKMTGPRGDVRRLEAVITNLLAEPSVAAMVATIRDQTERYTLEEQLNQSQKMEAVGQLAGGVAHDFNNLLTTILGHSEMGMETLGEDDPVYEDLAQIKRASELAASLTRQLLAFSRKQIIEPRVVEVGESVNQVAKLAKRLIKADVTTVIEIAPDPGRVLVDPSQLEQALLNLAVNARDAMPNGGRLTIRTRSEVVVSQPANAVIPIPTGPCVVVEVADTGTGIDAATQARIFEPFFTTKPVGRGTGLGLATVYAVVKQNGGGLVLESALGRGTKFSIYFTKAEQPIEITDGDQERRRAVKASATILLVDDEGGLRQVANKVLSREGYRILVAADADDALTLAASAQFPIDLLLTDVVMPGMSGPKLAQELKSQRPELVTLFMSGYAGDELTGELKDDQYFLRKPFTPFVLLEHVRAALQNTRRASK